MTWQEWLEQVNTGTIAPSATFEDGDEVFLPGPCQGTIQTSKMVMGKKSYQVRVKEGYSLWVWEHQMRKNL